MNKKGISMLILAVTITVMAILITASITGINLATNNAKTLTFAQDLKSISDGVKETYTLTGRLPVENTEYTKEQILSLVSGDVRTDLEQEMIQNRDDEDVFYVVKLDEIGATRSKRGIKKEPSDIYVVSLKNENIYYVEGLHIGNKRYFSLTDELCTLTNVKRQEVVENKDLSEKLSVAKEEKTWTNAIHVNVATLLEEGQIVKMEFPNGAMTDITTFVKGKEQIIISKDTCGETNIKNAGYVLFKKYSDAGASGKLLDAVRMPIGNLDYTAPTLTDADLEIIKSRTSTKIIYKSDDPQSGIKDVRYQVVSKKIDEEHIEEVETSVPADADATGALRKRIADYLQTYGKVASTKIMKFESKTYRVRIIVGDRAGNYSDYKEIELNSFDIVNSPILITGMIPIKWNGTKFVETTSDDEEWYDYSVDNKRWANAITKNTSGQITGYYVWIPRYAYRKEDGTNESDNKTGRFEVKFLIGKTEKSYNPVSKKIEEITDDYIIHPAFQDGTATNFINGEWDAEIEGFWVPKFEAGFASKGNPVSVTKTMQKYQSSANILATVPTVEMQLENYTDKGNLSFLKWLEFIASGSKTMDITNLRNCVDYRKDQDWGATTTNMSYPVFLPNTASYNYLSTSDMYVLSKALNDSGNPYGFSKVDADTHMAKNSEWGAITYLAHSQYGVNDKVITPNRANAASRTFELRSIYAITAGGDGNNQNGNANFSTKTPDEVMASAVNQTTTGNIYGIYDMSGGAYEVTSGYIGNSASEFENYYSLTHDKSGNRKELSDKYSTKYSYDATRSDSGSIIEDAAALTRAKANYDTNSAVGDALKETSVCTQNWISISQEQSAGWEKSVAQYFVNKSIVLRRGGKAYDPNSDLPASIYAFERTMGQPGYLTGFRPIIIPKD